MRCWGCWPNTGGVIKKKKTKKHCLYHLTKSAGICWDKVRNSQTESCGVILGYSERSFSLDIFCQRVHDFYKKTVSGAGVAPWVQCEKCSYQRQHGISTGTHAPVTPMSWGEATTDSECPPSVGCALNGDTAASGAEGKRFSNVFLSTALHTGQTHSDLAPAHLSLLHQ